MRVVAVADTHLFTGDFEVPDGDIFIHAGDLCRHGDLDELADAAAWIASLPHPHKIVIAGNHDRAFVSDPAAARALVRDAIYLEDGGATVAGLAVYGTPWQPAFHDWAFNLPRGAPLAAKWAQIPAGLDILITHSPPAGIGDDFTLLGRAGCADLLARVNIVRPRLHVFGHIHQDGGVWNDHGTTFANVTTWECSRGATVFDIDATTVRPVVVPHHGRRDDW